MMKLLERKARYAPAPGKKSGVVHKKKPTSQKIDMIAKKRAMQNESKNKTGKMLPRASLASGNAKIPKGRAFSRKGY
jgi:hypothetical protein